MFIKLPRVRKDRSSKSFLPSISATDRFFLASNCALIRPAQPAPIMTTSKVFMFNEGGILVE